MISWLIGHRCWTWLGGVTSLVLVAAVGCVDQETKADATPVTAPQRSRQLDLPFDLELWSQTSDQYGPTEQLVFTGNHGLVVEVQISRGVSEVRHNGTDVQRRRAAFGEDVLWAARLGEGPVEASWRWQDRLYRVRVLSPAYWTLDDLIGFAEALVAVQW